MVPIRALAVDDGLLQFHHIFFACLVFVGVDYEVNFQLFLPLAFEDCQSLPM